MNVSPHPVKMVEPARIFKGSTNVSVWLVMPALTARLTWTTAPV